MSCCLCHCASVAKYLFFYLIPTLGQSEVFANVQDSKPCYGSIVNVTCSFPEDLKQYAAGTPSWKRNGDMYQPDAITHKLINYNTTLHILRINLTGDVLISKTLEYACYLIKTDHELDESEVHIAPQGYYNAYGACIYIIKVQYVCADSTNVLYNSIVLFCDVCNMYVCIKVYICFSFNWDLYVCVQQNI